MPKKQTLIIYPRLKDCNGDLSKQWYVEYTYTMPGEEKPRRERVYKGLSVGTTDDRKKVANKIIKEISTWLKKEQYLKENTPKVFKDELLYRNDTKQYAQTQQSIATSRNSLSEFLLCKKQQVSDKTYQDYQSKMRTFNQFLIQKKWDHIAIQNIAKKHIVEFAMYLSDNIGLSRLTIDKYIQIVRAFFDFQIDKEVIYNNPAKNIPKMGKIVDMSAVPFSTDERKMLKDAIADKDPQLWLACQIQFYCAIRPGTEIRLMKISWIDIENKQFIIPNVEAKNNTTEVVEMPEILQKELMDYNIQLYNKDLYLFGQNGMPGVKPLGKNTMRNRFNRYRLALGLPDTFKFYSWKHTGAISLMNAGAQPYDVMEHLRHKNFDTTEKYLKKRIKNPQKRISKFIKEI